MSSVSCWFHTASSWPVCLQQWDREAGKHRPSLWWTDSLFWSSLWDNSNSNGCLLRISDLTWGEWGDYSVSALRSEERQSFCSGKMGSEGHWNVKRWLCLVSSTLVKPDIRFLFQVLHDLASPFSRSLITTLLHVCQILYQIKIMSSASRPFINNMIPWLSRDRRKIMMALSLSQAKPFVYHLISQDRPTTLQ